MLEWIYNKVLRPLAARLDGPCHACVGEDEDVMKDWRDCDCDEGRIARANYEREQEMLS
jgi:hypothetical protein